MTSVNTCSLCVNLEYCGERDRLSNLSEYPFLSITSPATNLQHLSGGYKDLNTVEPLLTDTLNNGHFQKWTVISSPDRL